MTYRSEILSGKHLRTMRASSDRRTEPAPTKRRADAPGCCRRGLCPPISRLRLCRVGDRAEITLPIVVQASRLPARGIQAGRLHHNHEVAKLVLARCLSVLNHGAGVGNRVAISLTSGKVPEAANVNDVEGFFSLALDIPATRTQLEIRYLIVLRAA